MRIVSSLFGLIIGIAFSYGGVQLALETTIPTYQSWQTMKSWQSMSAELVSVKEAGDVEAVYRYSIASVGYQNDRVYVALYKDNLGRYHQELAEYLQELKANQQPVAIWYDPYDPEQSVIDREIRWSSFILMTIFSSLFILIGLVVAIRSMSASTRQKNDNNKRSLLTLRKQWRQKQINENYSDSFIDFCQQQSEKFLNKNDFRTRRYKKEADHPWLNRKEWRDHCFRSNSKQKIYALWVFSIVWIGMCLPLLIALEDEVYQGNYAALLGLLFPIAGLFLIKKAWTLTKEWQHYGEIKLEMDPFPGSIGGHVGGSLLVNNITDYNAKYKIELQCVHHSTSGGGKQNSHSKKIKWAEAGFAKTEARGNAVQLKFRFEVPENLPESDVEQRGSYYFWRLKVLSENSSIKLDYDYNIPVFKTRVQSKSIHHDISSQVEENRKEKALESKLAIDRGDFSSTALARALIYKNKGAEQIFYYPMFRNKMLSLFALVFAIGFCFATYSINNDFGNAGMIKIGMLIFSLPFALVGFFASIAAIYLPLNNLSVTISGREIKAIRRLFIFPIKRDVILGSEINKMEIKSTGSTG